MKHKWKKALYNIFNIKSVKNILQKKHLIISLESLETYIFMLAKNLFGELDKYKIVFYLGFAFYLGIYGNLSYVGQE